MSATSPCKSVDCNVNSLQLEQPLLLFVVALPVFSIIPDPLSVEEIAGKEPPFWSFAPFFLVGSIQFCFGIVCIGREAMGKMGYLAMKTDEAGSAQRLIESDLRELRAAAANLATDTMKLTSGLGVGTTFLKFLASVAAIYLLILDRTNWRTNMLTSLLVPYIFLSLPSVVFHILRGEFGKWVAFIAVVLRLFFPRHFPDWLEMPGSLILLLVVAPNLLAHTVRDGVIGVIICLIIACYLLQEHIRASGGFRNSFTKSNGVSNSLGIIILLVYPIWRLVLHFL